MYTEGSTTTWDSFIFSTQHSYIRNPLKHFTSRSNFLSQTATVTLLINSTPTLLIQGRFLVSAESSLALRSRAAVKTTSVLSRWWQRSAPRPWNDELVPAVGVLSEHRTSVDSNPSAELICVMASEELPCAHEGDQHFWEPLTTRTRVALLQKGSGSWRFEQQGKKSFWLGHSFRILIVQAGFSIPAYTC